MRRGGLGLGGGRGEGRRWIECEWYVIYFMRAPSFLFYFGKETERKKDDESGPLCVFVIWAGLLLYASALSSSWIGVFYFLLWWCVLPFLGARAHTWAHLVKKSESLLLYQSKIQL